MGNQKISFLVGVSGVVLAAATFGAPLAAWADGGRGGSTLTATGGAGGVDGTAAQAVGQPGVFASGSSAGGGGGGGAVDLTTGDGAHGGAEGIGNLGSGNGAVLGAAGATGGPGAIFTAPAVVSTVTTGVAGGPGQRELNNGNTSGGGGGGGVGVSTPAALTINGAVQVTGGAGGVQNGAGGGGGGVGVFSSAMVTVAAGGRVTGGAGGGSNNSFGGGGGGMGVLLRTGGGLINSGAVLGGVGGFVSLAGGGGDGGAGVLATGGGTVTNQVGGSITGGVGGSQKHNGIDPASVAGLGGAGVKGSGITLINAGAITGAMGGISSGGAVPVRAAAVQFTGGVNSLEIQSGSTITGNVVAFSTADTLRLGGITNDSFDVSAIGPAAQYRSFGHYEKTGAGTWTLMGATTAVTPWTLTAGVLSVSSDDSLGDPSSGVVFNGGTLQLGANLTLARGMTLAAAGTIDTQANTDVVSGAITGGGALTKVGSGVLSLTGVDAYTGGTTVSAGELRVENGGQITATSMVSVVDGAVTVDGVSSRLVTTGTLKILSGVMTIAGGGQVTPGAGTLVMGPDTAVLNIGGQEAAAATAAGGLNATQVIVGNAASRINFNHTDAAYDFDAAISGVGAVNQRGTGTTILTADNSYTGATNINAGVLRINGDQSAAIGATTVTSGGTLGGSGIVGGNVAIATGGALAPGNNSPGTLTINGDLTLSHTAALNYEFGQSNVVGGPMNDLTKVGRDLTLDGTINVAVTAGGVFDVGLYRVISYGGVLNGAGLAPGTGPSTDVTVQTSIDHQVNLVNTQGLTLNFWDGGNLSNAGDSHVNGGAGTWRAGGDSSWTTESGVLNAPYANGSFAIFAAAPGLVTVDDTPGAVTASGMQFAVDGYRVEGAPLMLSGATTIRVGDGTQDGAGYTATIASEFTGTGGLTKTDLGTLVLTGANTYAGATQVDAGRLEIDGDQSGAAAPTTVNASGTLAGSGVIGGSVTVAGGKIAPGTAARPGTLTINSDLMLNGASSLNYRLGQAGTVGETLNDLLVVHGNLTLAGTLNVTTSAGGTYGPGVYRLISYDDVLTDDGLAVGMMPGSGTNTIQTSINHEVNLINTPSPSGGGGGTPGGGNPPPPATSLNFWDGGAGVAGDGAITGGDGVWRGGAGSSWTQASGGANGQFDSGIFAIFAAAPGTVTVDDSQGAVGVSGLQFASDGYKITGDAVGLDAGDAIVRVGDGTVAGAAFKATIGSELTGAGRLEKTDLGTLILTGSNSYAGGTTIASGTLQLGGGGASGSITGDVADNGTLAFDRSDAVTFGGVISGAGVIQQIGAGVTVLTADSSAFTGRTEVRAGGLDVDGVLGGGVEVFAGGRLAGTGKVGSVTNQAGGLVAPGHGGIGTLAVGGDYAGAGGGLEIEAVLGGDASPADRLVIAGATSGVTPVAVVNLGGTGAQTAQGIPVVQVGGLSAGRFVLANGDYVIAGQQALVAGAYGYTLQQGQRASGQAGDWYLRSTLVDPAIPAGGAAEPPQVTLYQPGVPVYEAYASTLMTLTGTSTLRQRVGERQWDVNASGDDGVWGRMTGSTTHLEPVTSTGLVHDRVNNWTAQFGADRVLSGSDSARLVGGITAQYGQASTKLASPYGGGDVDTKAYGVGATLTWYGPAGLYLDTQAQATWFDSDLTSQLVGREAGGEGGHGQALSLEAGQTFAATAGFTLTPQVQLTYASTGFDAFTDRFGAVVSSDRGDSLKGRIGVALDNSQTWRDAGGQTRELKLYGLVDLSREFLDGVRVQVSGTPIDDRQGRTWGGLGAGGNYSWGDGRYAIYGEASADTDLGQFGDSYSVTATAGFRMRF